VTEHGPGDADTPMGEPGQRRDYVPKREWRTKRVLVGDGWLDDPEQRDADTPVDLGAVRCDDALLDVLGSVAGQRAAHNGTATGYLADPVWPGDELETLLLSWRQDVDSEPYREVVDTETAVSTVLLARYRARRRARRLVPLTAAAAVLAIAFAGVGLAARQARPGDPLWGLTQLFYADHAHSLEAALAVQTDLNAARFAISQGRIDDACSALAEAKNSLSMVAAEDGKSDLSRTHDNLVQQLGTTATRVTASSPSSAPEPSTEAVSTTTTTRPTTTPTPTTTTGPVDSTTQQTSVSSSTPPVNAGIGDPSSSKSMPTSTTP